MHFIDKRGRVEPIAKRVRAVLDGHVVVDSSSPRIVWENPYYPAAYYLPIGDFLGEALRPTERRDSPENGLFGEARYFDVAAGARVAKDAACHFPTSTKVELEGLVRLDWDAMDAWFEEEEEVFVHPHDPWARIDILHGSRHVEVFCDGTKLAESRRPTLLYETGLPCRYYLPKTDVRMDLLQPTDTRTGCAYKGFARYWSYPTPAKVHANIAWSYPAPLAEAVKIAGLVCFYAERLDMHVDGVALPRPRTPFSTDD
jgi:uncharacterized protein (DUF427 family)